MRKHLAGAFGALAALGLALASPGAAASSDDRQDPVARTAALAALENLRLLYAQIDSVELKAHTKTYIAENPAKDFAEAVGAGSYEYAADRDKYRIASNSAGNLGLAQDTILAFDGLQFQFHAKPVDVISLQQERPRSLPASLPNPFFLPLDFAIEDGDACNACQLDLLSATTRIRWEKLYEQAKVVGKLSDPQLLVIVPAPERAIEPFDFYIYLENMGELGLLPRRIDRYSKDGKIMGRVAIRSYEATALAGGQRFPLARHVSLSAVDFRGSGEQVMFTDIFLDEAALNPDFSSRQNLFTLDLATASTVWDTDAKVFVKHHNSTILDPQAYFEAKRKKHSN